MPEPQQSAPARPVIEDVRPRVDDGKYDAKATLGDRVRVEADVFADGHDLLACEIRYRHDAERSWKSAAMQPLGNDRWRAGFTPTKLGRYRFSVRAQVDRFGTWLHELRARLDAGQDVAIELLVGAAHLRAAAERAKAADGVRLGALADQLADGSAPDPLMLIDADLLALAARYPEPDGSATSPVYGVHVDRTIARFSAWYELFPRSTASKPGQHGTFADVARRLDYVASLGADVLYLPPIHPIGVTKRKGRNGAVDSVRGDVGSPWAIGGAAGGHTAVHPDLGTLADFDKLVDSAERRGIEIALDLAFQCAPDHPWVTEHPQWFKHRPDGTIRYAENPPKRYEDIYPIDFETADWLNLWRGLHEVVTFWIGHGVAIFRVDNPHTKPFAFWEWLIPAVQAEHPQVVFLAEAFTRPKIMYRLAKIGFSQSYTYFAWRNAKWELEQYLTELTATPVAEFFRPNFWPNTPDILTADLQHGTRATFIVRALLAGTLSSSYGIYGPVYELGERASRFAGSEEYLDGEKYEVRHFDLDDADSLAPFLRRLNAIRREHLALHHNSELRFHPADNEQLIAYSKTVPDGAGGAEAASGTAAVAAILVVANLDPHHEQAGWVDLDLAALGLDPTAPYTVHDLLTGVAYRWEGSRNFVLLDPAVAPAHLFRVEPVAGALR